MNLYVLGLLLLSAVLAGCSGFHPADENYFSSGTPSTPGSTPPVTASSSRLMTITNDRNAIVNAIDFQVSAAGALQSLIYVTDNAGAVSQKNFTAAQLANGYGAVLEEQSGVQAVLLRVQLDSASGTGQAVLRFITNVFSGSYSECSMNVRRAAGGAWAVYNAYTGQLTTSAAIVSSSLGITTVNGICP